ncbi:MAG: 50S ribosomal protein L5 [SAR202 cluster bacterium]|nr:50S ribosomal protein L5 [Chloroflexota bacterium]MBO19658.1 50S ribosomal protein L5 [Chloroflexota bacterium]MQF94686.1 50S ribosomal protein L5 [SAR202 cluster bacterium]MQG34084.1 50S ribosomal protein L5 [SAR202 cluster bacterium]HCP23446.1 50S ribosomal protein L5 [Dehalococcoidia bacterium]|tara:strand:+ start:4425 stop:5162 length:738 start_codon:yes stop_codon:yes gene_type:complete
MLDEETQQPEDLEETQESQDSEAAGGEVEQPEAEDSSRRQRRERGGRAGAAVLEPPTEPPPAPRLKEKFKSEIIPTMVREFSYANPMEVPRLQKIVLNIGVGEALTNGRAIEAAGQDLTTISGQKPIVTRARQSIAGFKIRQGNAIGTAVTLRGDRMYHFLDRLVNTALPRIRDFRGLPRRGLDGRGNFSIGIREQIIFPEIDYNDIDRIRGLQVTIATTAKNDTEAMRLLELYGMPFVRETVEA